MDAGWIDFLGGVQYNAEGEVGYITCLNIYICRDKLNFMSEDKCNISNNRKAIFIQFVGVTNIAELYVVVGPFPIHLKYKFLGVSNSRAGVRSCVTSS